MTHPITGKRLSHKERNLVLESACEGRSRRACVKARHATHLEIRDLDLLEQMGAHVVARGHVRHPPAARQLQGLYQQRVRVALRKDRRREPEVGKATGFGQRVCNLANGTPPIESLKAVATRGRRKRCCLGEPRAMYDDVRLKAKTGNKYTRTGAVMGRNTAESRRAVAAKAV